MNIRLLNAAAVRELLPMERCLTLMRDAMRLVATERAGQPIRRAVPLPDGSGLLGLMPGYTEEPRWLGVKVVTVFPGNFGTPLGSHQGLVLLFDASNGVPRAVVEAREITSIRTAAATAVATEALARADVRTLGIFGYGEQARAHIRAVPLVRRFTEILVWGRDSSRAHALVEEMSDEVRCVLRAVDRPEQAAAADVVCTVTAAKEPFYRADWLEPGQHLNLVGASVPSAAEAEPEVIRRARVFTDYRESALALAGEFRRALETGLIDEDHLVGEIGEVLAELVPGRTSAEDVTIFKSLGMIAEDLLSADFVLREAEERRIGEVIDW